MGIHDPLSTGITPFEMAIGDVELAELYAEAEAEKKKQQQNDPDPPDPDEETEPVAAK